MPLVLLAVTRPPARTGEHLLGALATLLVIAGVWLAMRRGWQRKAARQATRMPAPLPLRATDGAVAAEGVYLGTTGAGAWLERVTAHGLGTRSAVRVRLSAESIDLDRGSARSFAIPREAVVAIGQDTAHAGKVTPDARVLVITWTLGTELLDTGLRLPSADAAADLLAQLAPLAPVEVPR